MKPYDVVVVGGGAAGIVAAISAKRKGGSVLLCEKMPRLGKKILISGAGRCNLSNEVLDPSFYNPEARRLVGSVLEKFNTQETLNFFRELGLWVYSDGGRIFPVTNQAASVLDVLCLELKQLKIACELHCEIIRMEGRPGGFILKSNTGGHFTGRNVVLSGGGKSYPALGADGHSYELAQRFGHHLIEPVPSAVPLLVKDPWCHLLQGQKIRAVVTAIIGEKTGVPSPGEVLFTQYGLSGTAVLDVSEEISVAWNRQGVKNIAVSVDLVPFMKENELSGELSARQQRGMAPENLLTGLLPHKFSSALSVLLHQRDAGKIASDLKNKIFKVGGTRGWNEAEFTAGGIDAAEVKEGTLESVRQKGLYLAGEILNVQGRRGGYNLAWAWASGFVAGLTS